MGIQRVGVEKGGSGGCICQFVGPLLSKSYFPPNYIRVPTWLRLYLGLSSGIHYYSIQVSGEGHRRRDRQLLGAVNFPLFYYERLYCLCFESEALHVLSFDDQKGHLLMIP